MCIPSTFDMLSVKIIGAVVIIFGSHNLTVNLVVTRNSYSVELVNVYTRSKFNMGNMGRVLEGDHSVYCSKVY
jgi:hypothetical protein